MISCTHLFRAIGIRRNETAPAFSIRKFAVAGVGFFVLVSVFLLPGSLAAQDAKFDSDSVSGLGARNIGSAAMSGRVAALTAVKEDGRLTVYIGAASGGVWKSVNGGTTFKPVFDKQTAQSIRRRRKRFGSAQASRGRAIAFRLATAFTSRWTAVKTGRIWA